MQRIGRTDSRYFATAQSLPVEDENVENIHQVLQTVSKKYLRVNPCPANNLLRAAATILLQSITMSK